MRRRAKVAVLLLLGGLCAIFAIVCWAQWGAWPDPVGVVPTWQPDAIVVLGGGNEARSREAMRWHERFPEVPVVVTGDGGVIRRQLLQAGLPPDLLHHEDAATSTQENARYTDGILQKIGANRVLLISNWFHTPRALAVFRKQQPSREFGVAFEPKPDPLTLWDRRSQRRERWVSLIYLLRYGVVAF